MSYISVCSLHFINLIYYYFQKLLLKRQWLGILAQNLQPLHAYQKRHRLKSAVRIPGVHVLHAGHGKLSVLLRLPDTVTC